MYQTLDIAQLARNNADSMLKRNVEYDPQQIAAEQEEHKKWLPKQYSYESMASRVNDVYLPPRRSMIDNVENVVSRASTLNSWILWIPIGSIVLSLLTFIMVMVLVFRRRY
jgi:hypothetical protein